MHINEPYGGLFVTLARIASQISNLLWKLGSRWIITSVLIIILLLYPNSRTEQLLIRFNWKQTLQVLINDTELGEEK